MEAVEAMDTVVAIEAIVAMEVMAIEVIQEGIKVYMAVMRSTVAASDGGCFCRWKR